MEKMTRDQFLAQPAGIVYIEQSAHDIGPAIKGPTGDNGLFQKRVVRPNDKGTVSLVERTQADQDQPEFHVLDDVEAMTCQALIFSKLAGWTPEDFKVNVLHLIETLIHMPQVRVQLPNGRTINGDGTDIKATADGPSSVN